AGRALGARGQRAHAAELDGCRGRDALVDDGVAVVVDPVAQLLPRRAVAGRGIVHGTVAIVVEAVAGLGLRVGGAGGPPVSRQAPSWGDADGRRARLDALTVGRRGLAAGDGIDVVVGDPVAVVVAAVADLGAGDAASGADVPLVHLAVAVVVEAVADLRL